VSICSCNNGAQSEAVKQAEAIQKAVKENTPGAIATSGNGYYMKANIDGKAWSASFMIPDDNASSSYKMIHGENGGDNIHFQIWKRGIEIGKKILFDENHAADLTLESFDGFLAGKSGEIVIVKMDDQWMQGTFKFTATASSSDKKVEVTNGEFRVPLVPGLK
jgi:hypothetical protein